ncbi:MAG: hypothetical protein IJM35_10450 [Bacteroidales bacterium]|nr:hypothetical protein [Bacteroidales bacterium]
MGIILLKAERDILNLDAGDGSEQWGLDTTELTTPDGLMDESPCTIEEEDVLKVWGPGYRGMPRDAIHSPAGFADLIGWKQKRIR